MISFAIITFLYFSGLVLTRGILIYTVEPRSKWEHIVIVWVCIFWPLLAMYLTIKNFIK